MKSSFPEMLQALVNDPLWQGYVFVLTQNDRSKRLVALGCEKEIIVRDKQFLVPPTDQSYWFCALSYDLKNELEDVSTRHISDQSFGLAHWVKPKVVLEVSAEGIRPLYGELSASLLPYTPRVQDAIELQPRQTKEEYIQSLHKVKAHLQAGDIYEVNYCQEYFAHAQITAPWEVFKKLDSLTEAPFAAYVQLGDKGIICGSPERFIQRKGNRIISQPIKGTARRAADSEQDNLLKQQLLSSKKERAENVMIVDLVRNDFSRIAQKNTVQVEELFGVYTFKTVHHLISTISAELKPDVSLEEILRATFPMGSMTGAPKINAMKIADTLEASARGMYSGSIGYIAPNGDFDFNVVIRSIVYDNTRNYVSSHVGGAITIWSHPEQEYDECQLKAAAVLRALSEQ